jgi:PAS domain S-box-containing protein
MAGHDTPPVHELFDTLDIGLIVIGAGRRIVAWNAWMASASGIAETAACGRRIEELFPPERARRLRRAVAEALRTGATTVITHALHPGLLALRTPAGQALLHTISVRASAGPGRRRCIIQVFDVTAAARRETVLRERQNARYNAVVDSAADAILTMDSAGLIQMANPSALRSLGYAPAEMLGQPITLLFGQEAQWTTAWAALLRGERQQRPLDLVARRRDGSLSFVEMSASRWSSDDRFFVTAILRDVNERHRAERALRHLNETLEERVALAIRQRKLLADMVEATDGLVLAVDLDRRILAVNTAQADAFARLFGTRPCVGDDLHTVLVPDREDARRILMLWDRALRGERFTSLQHLGPERALRWYELKFDTLHDAEGRRVAAFQFAYDVTARVDSEMQLAQAQEALRQSQKMEAIGQLTGGIAHDFNNLLTGIIGAMDVLKRRLAARRYEDTARFMDAAVASANRAAALTHRLLAFARRQPLDPRPVDVNRLIQGTEELLSRTIGEQVALHTDLAEGLWPALSDTSQLESAILNLAINARDAMPEGGRLVLSTRNAVLRETTAFAGDEVLPGDYVVVTVADTGAGMPPGVVARAFEPFFTTKPLGQGTGLGLSMVYGFAKQTRGGVGIESDEGRGTRISIYLPRFLGTAAREDEAPAEELPRGQGMNVLLVEDDASVRLLIAEVLRELGYSCIEATDGQAALPILASNIHIDLMITDVGLPGMNGHQVARLARQQRPNLRVLFVTGYAEHATGDTRFLEAGMTMITKPFSLDLLALRIRDMLAPP